MNELLSRKITDLADKLEHLRGFLDLAHKLERIKAIDVEMSKGDFWSNQDAANKVIREAKGLKSVVEPFNAALKHVQDAKELLEIAEGDVQMEQQIEADVAIVGAGPAGSSARSDSRRAPTSQPPALST